VKWVGERVAERVQCSSVGRDRLTVPLLGQRNEALALVQPGTAGRKLRFVQGVERSACGDDGQLGGIDAS
jgi:hypothetical protein